ncbi:hypothetical protein ACFYZU_33770 [Streptomyces sp. NPDC001651]|uniref:hypothetical protein n=1 Tax=Streptomyces sp. NPDC001651 TaxID=3364596 RepID=UPI0036CA986C
MQPATGSTGRPAGRAIVDGVGPREIELAVAGEVRLDLGVGGDPAEQGLVGERGRVEAAGNFGGQGVAREDVAEGVEGDGPPVVLLEVRLDGFGGAVGEEAEEVSGAVRVQAARGELDARAGAPGAAAGLPPQAGGDPRGAEALVDKGRVVQERAQRGGHLVDDTGPDLFVVGGVRAHLRLVVKAADEHTGRGEEDGEVVTRAVVH